MSNETTEQPQTLITTKFIALIKERIWLIIGSLLSSSILAYIFSRFFIKTYLDEIGYPSLIYSSLLDSSTVSVLTLGILSVVIGFLFVFVIVPSSLRVLYFHHIKLYEKIHKKETIGFFLFFYFASPLLMLIPNKSISYMGITYLVLLLFIVSYVVFIIWTKLTCRNKLTLLFSVFLFFLVTLLIFYPFLIFLQAIKYSDVSQEKNSYAIVFLWIAYSFFTAIRITFNEKIQYLVDLIIATLVMVGLMTLSSNTLKSPIAESIGIKDKDAKIYQFSQSNYDELSPSIQTFWQFETSCNIGDKNCSMLVANYDVSCTKDCDNPVYLNSQVIFRDNKNAIICPPNYEFGKNMNDRCLLIDQDILIPTSQTVEGLINNKKITTINYVMNEAK
ncbi:hypothetical protein VH441_05945 [Psychrobacter sp. HD31]|uniref:hypothetical protein n=1 Tax=Psychrobacter sp. HD31 TaxID=3112003 RepID=UPI003DA5E665